MIAWAGRWTRTASTTPLHPKNEMLIFGLCWTSNSRLGWSMDSNPIHLPSQAKKNEMLIFGLHLTSDDWPGWSLDSNPIHLLSEAKQNEVLIFGLHLTSDDQPGWLMNLNPICLPSPAKKWSAHFWIMFNFWWLAGLVNGLEPHLPPVSSQKNEMLIFGLLSISDHWLGSSIALNPICHLSPGIKWNAHFCITFNFWWSAGLVDGLKPNPPPFSNQKNEMLIFGLHSTSDDQPGWSMDSNPICHPSPAKKWNANCWIMLNFW